MYAKVSVALMGVEGVIIFTSITEVRIILLLDINTMCFALVMFNNHREKRSGNEMKNMTEFVFSS